MPRYKSVHTGPQIDSGVARALSGGAIDAALESKMEIEFLDNTDFTNPVAQAGIGGLHGSVAYAVDRWKLISGTVSGSSNGLTLNGKIRQIREFPIGFPVVPSIEMYSGTATITYDDTTKCCDITSSGGIIKRPHLGLWAITDWAKIPAADYGEELRKCQRYFFATNALNTAYAAVGVGQSRTTTAVSATVSCPSTMRTAPTISTKSGSLANLIVRNADNMTQCSNAIIDVTGAGCILITAITVSNVTPGLVFDLFTQNSDSVFFSADL